MTTLFWYFVLSLCHSLRIHVVIFFISFPKQINVSKFKVDQYLDSLRSISYVQKHFRLFFIPGETKKFSLQSIPWYYRWKSEKTISVNASSRHANLNKFCRIFNFDVRKFQINIINIEYFTDKSVKCLKILFWGICCFLAVCETFVLLVSGIYIYSYTLVWKNKLNYFNLFCIFRVCETLSKHPLAVWIYQNLMLTGHISF